MRSAAVLMVVGAAACGPSLDVVMTNPAPRPLVARASAQVELYTTRAPDRPYVEVAVITASRGRAHQHLDALREKGGELGCDAVVITVMPSETNVTVTNQDPAQAGKLHNQSEGVGVDSSSGTCIVYTTAAAPGAF